MNSGLCHGGPYDGKSLHHPAGSCRVALDPYPRRGIRAIPGMIASVDPEVQFGTYRFAAGAWTWHESPESAPTNPVNNETR